jgi:hypothetical protein
MIGYRFNLAQLEADFAADDAAKQRKEPWLKKAERLTATLKKSPRKKMASEWSEIKGIYTRRQRNKCVYCECRLGPHELSAVAVDVEHFRPKNAVKVWPTADAITELGLSADFPRSPGSGKGYRHLAYHPLNYASSCKTCNSRLKANYFPIAGKHDFNGIDPVTLFRKEKPYLVYPLGDFDDDPESIVGFEGFVAVPAARKSNRHAHNRGRVVIAFFRLNDVREDLLLLRAKQLDSLLTKIELLEKERKRAQRTVIWSDIELLKSEKNDHAGCIRHLLRRYGHPDDRPAPPSRAEARRDLQRARDYVRSRLKP